MTYRPVEHQIKEYKYHTIQENLTPQEIARFVCKIQESKEYDLGQLGHVLITGTEIAVGYIGDDKIDLVDSHENSLHSHHNLLIDILSACLI